MNLQNADTLGAAILIIVFLAAFVLVILGIIEKVKHKPPLHKEYATRDDHIELKGQVSQLSHHVNDRLEREKDERKASVSRVYQEMEKEMKAFSLKLDTIDTRSEERSTKVHERVNELSHRVDTVPDRVVRLLKESKEI